MKAWTERQAVELFHLLFLEHFGRTIDKSLYAIKGGCNLRFFLLSPRFSEDLDLDIRTIEKSTLQNKVERLFDSTPFRISLKARGLDIKRTSAPKQTTTTQRWKLSISLANGVAIHTKIEFSRRGMFRPTSFEPIDRTLALTYRLAPVMATHYTKESACAQKLEALAGRLVTQARDLFDLHHLIQCGADLSQVSSQPILASRACEAALDITFEDYCSLVVAYLPDNQQELYRSKSLWEQMVLGVVESLEP